jgi:2-C-methyl-D-erythritol 2,4-cyclodiphosphate synthase
MLGALALGDIGIHFPNTEPKWKNADSSVLLKHVNELIQSKGYELGNLDCVLAMEKPKISPYVDEIRKRISEILNTYTDQISIKATTTEKLGFVGRTEGVVAFATVLLAKKDFNV